MREAGYQPHFLAPVGESWLSLAAELERLGALPGTDRLFVVYGDEVTSHGQRGLGLLNQLRDRLGTLLDAPLVWCGPARFLEGTWSAMPDFWSVRALPVRLAPAHVGAPKARLSERLWFRADPRGSLGVQALLDLARSQGDATASAAITLDLAEALAADGNLGAAERLLDDTVVTTVEGARLQALLRVALGQTVTPRPELGVQVSAAVAAANGDLVAADRLLTVALDSGVQDAALRAQRGDVRAARGDLADADADWRAAAARFQAEGDGSALAVAEEALAEIAQASDRAWDASVHLQRAAAILRDQGDSTNEARIRALLGAQPSTGRQVADAPRLFTAARELASRHPRPEQIRRRLEQAGAERLQFDLTGSAALIWSRVLGQLARSGHSALLGLLDESEQGSAPTKDAPKRAILTWLQISGLRCGGTTARTRRRLLEDACARATEHGAPDAVFVLGDVTQDATPGQFAEAASWLSELADAVGVTPTSVFVVPGPRDLTVVPEVEPVLVRHRARPLYVDEVLREPDETHPDRTDVRARRLADRAALWQRLAAFGAFTLQDGSPAWGHPAPAEAHPFWVGAVGGVHVVGLNSALLSAPPSIAPGDSADTLALGMSQLEVLARLPPDAPVVVLSHHGPAQLADGMLLSGLLSTRPHILLHTGEVPFLGCLANRALGELVVRTPAPEDAPGVAWGALERAGLTVWHRRWDPAVGDWAPRESPERVHRSREDLPPPLDRWLTGTAALPTANAQSGGGEFDPSRVYVDVPISPAESIMVGRDGVLSRMRHALVGAQVGALGRALALVGFGGLGKTRLAFEYARRYQGDYPGGVYIFHADTDVEAQLIQLGERARWVSPRSDRASARMIASHRIRQARDALLVFDNLDDLAKIRGYLPPASLGSHLLVTSRVEQPGFVSLAPALLDRDASRRLLVTESGRPPDGPEENAAVDWLAERLDGLPLALELAAAWMRRHTDLRWVAYGERLRAEGLGARELRDRVFVYESATAHTNDLRRTLRVTESVFEESPLLRRVLDLLAWSGPGPMSASLLAAALDVTELELAQPIATGTALRILRAEGDGAAIHRLVAEVRREEVALDSVWAGGVLSRLGRWFEVRREEFSDLATFEANTPHLLAWEAHAGVLGEPVEAARLAWLQGIGPAARGLYREADGHFQRAWRGLVACDTCGTVLGARVGGAIARMLHELGSVREVEAWRRAAFSTLRSALPVAPETAGAEAALGVSLTTLGRYAEASVHLEHAVGCLHESGDGVRLAHAWGARRFLSQAQGDYPAALECATRALVAWPTSRAADPDLAGLVCGRAGALSALGRSAEAEVEARSADAMIVHAFGERHPTRGDSLHQVAITLLDRGEFDRGRRLLTEAVGLVEPSSPTSPSLVLLFSGLGRAEYRQYHLAAATVWYERAVGLVESIYGHEHREYASALANASLPMDDAKRKLDRLLRARAITANVLGREHPDVATSFLNVGLTRCALGDHRLGIEEIGRGVALLERILGPDHPQTLSSLGHLGWAFDASGRPGKAIVPLTRARDGLARCRGPDHPETIVITGNLGGAIFDVGRREEGLQLVAEALRKSRRRSGLADPSTVTIACSLASLLAQQHRVSDALKVLDQHLAAVAPHSAEHDELKTLRDRIQPPLRLKPA